MAFHFHICMYVCMYNMYVCIMCRNMPRVDISLLLMLLDTWFFVAELCGFVSFWWFHCNWFRDKWGILYLSSWYTYVFVRFFTLMLWQGWVISLSFLSNESSRLGIVWLNHIRSRLGIIAQVIPRKIRYHLLVEWDQSIHPRCWKHNPVVKFTKIRYHTLV